MNKSIVFTKSNRKGRKELMKKLPQRAQRLRTRKRVKDKITAKGAPSALL